jgi:hypothetical protein
VASARRLPAAALAAVVALGGAAGCGLPEMRDPVVVATAPRPGAPSSGGEVERPRPDDVTEPRAFVERYLSTGAWGTPTADQPDAPALTAAAARRFLTARAAGEWEPGDVVTVVDAELGTSTPVASGGYHVTASLRTVGALTDRGEIRPAADPAPRSHRFDLVREADGQFRLTNPPPGLLLSTTGLQALYEAHPVYFWAADPGYLVPETRYLARNIQAEKRPNTVVRWVLAGPSDWLRPAVRPIPAGIEVKDNVTAGQRADEPIVINLSAKAAGVPAEELKRLVTQVRWSLRRYTSDPVPVQVQIESVGQPIDGSSGDYLDANPSISPDGRPPREYCVVRGQVRPVSGDPPRVLATEQNSGVESAAVSRNERSAALVRPEPGGRRRQLWVSANSLGAIGYQPTGIVAATMSRPVWHPSGRLLVAADGRLTELSTGAAGTEARQVPGMEGVGAFAVAPDGQRIAYLAGGRLYVALLLLAGQQLVVQSPQQLAPGVAEPGAVAWSREGWVLVAGSAAGDESALFEVSVDGGGRRPLGLGSLTDVPLARISAYPDPMTAGARPPMVEAGGRVWYVYTSGSVREVVVGADRGPGGPTPPAEQPAATAPFFAD